MTANVWNGSTWVESSVVVPGSSEDDAGYVWNGSSWVQFQPVYGALNPVTGLAASSTYPQATSMEVHWTLPANTPTPTEVQFRIPEVSGIWDTLVYPSTIAAYAALDPLTTYTFEVRLVYRAAGRTTKVSPTASLTFTTTAPDTPSGPADDPGSGGGGSIFHTPALHAGGTPGAVGSAGCSWEWKLQYGQDIGWLDTSPLITGTFTGLSTDWTYDTSTLDPTKIYRVAIREVCNLVPGAWNYGQAFSPVVDWNDVCGSVPLSADLGNAIYDDAKFYVPRICAPQVVRDKVSGVELDKSSGWSGVNLNDDPVNWALRSLGSYADGAAYHGIVMGHVAGVSQLVPGDFTIGFDMRLDTIPSAGEALTLVLGQNISFVLTPETGTTYSVKVESYLTTGPLTLQPFIHQQLSLGTAYKFFLRWDDDGDKTLFIDGVAYVTDSSGNGYARPTISDQFVLNLPPNALAWSIAGWTRLLSDAEIASTQPVINFIAVSFATDPSGGALSPAIPTGTLPGDFMIMARCVRQNSNTPPTVPSGWTLVASPSSGTRTRLFVYKRVATGTDVTLTSATGEETHVHILTFRAPTGINAQASAAAEGSSFTTLTQPSVAATVAGMCVDIFGINSDTATTAPTLDTLAKETQLSFLGSTLRTSYRQLGAVGATTGASITHNGNISSLVSLVLTP